MVRTTWIIRGVGKLSGSLHDLSAPRPKHGRRARAPERMTLGLYVCKYVCIVVYRFVGENRRGIGHRNTGRRKG